LTFPSPTAATSPLFDSSGLILHAAPLTEFSWLRHGSTTRQFSPADADRTGELHHLRRHLALPDSTPIIHAQQKHTASVGVVDEDVLGKLTEDRRFVFAETDAIVCSCAGVMLAILTADCAPVFIVDQRTRCIALAHAGWKGTYGRIVQNTVRTMVRQGSRVEDLVAWVGPMISGCCYEVSREMVEEFREGFPDAVAAGVEFNHGRHLDLVTLNAWQLRDCGLAPEHVHTSGVCTMHANDRFYSYRGDNGTTGRIISAMCVVGAV